MKQKDRIDIQVRVLNTFLAVVSAALLGCIARGFLAVVHHENVGVWGCGIGTLCCSLVIAGLCIMLSRKANEVADHD